MSGATNTVLRLDGGGAVERDVVGGKAWSIARMRALGLRVPPAFVVTTAACHAYFAAKGLSENLAREVDAAMAWLEGETGRTFGRGPRPLLVSVRSGAAVSMPGMMDTVLDLGIDDATEAALAAESGDPRFARDTHERFRDLFARIVLRGDAAVTPEDPREQLRRAIVAVFESSRSRRARTYRKHHGLADDLPTAVTIQAMVFGNLDDRSGTGVLFSRNPLSGSAEPYGEFLARAQGEDVVSGARTPSPLSELAALLPDAHRALLDGARRLEEMERDVQDVEFTIERGTLYFLQSRAAKRSPEAAVRIAVELAEEGRIDRAEALRRVTTAQVETLLRPRLVESGRAAATELARGEPACPGVGAGVVVQDCDEAGRRAAEGEAVVLARPTTSPEDVAGMIAAVAVVTDVGGSTSHAAVVSRSLGKPCVVGCGEGTAARLVGQVVTVDGERGQVLDGLVPLEQPELASHPYLSKLAAWTSPRGLLDVLREGSRT